MHEWVDTPLILHKGKEYVNKFLAAILNEC